MGGEHPHPAQTEVTQLTAPSSAPMDRTRLAGRVALGAAGVAALGVALALLGVSTAGAGLLAVGVGVLAFVRPDVGLWIVLIVFPFHPLLMRVAEVDFGLGGTPFLVISAWKEIAIAGMLGALIVSHVGSPDSGSLRQQLRRLTLPDYFAVALALLVAVGLLFDRSFLALSQARLLLFPLGVYIGGRANLIPSIRMFKYVTVAGAVIAVFGIIQSSLLGWSFVERYYSAPGLPRPYTFTAQFLDGPRAAGTLLSPNEFAFLMVIYAVMAGALIYRLPSRQKVWFVPILAAFVVALALSFSRSALIASVAGFATMLVLFPRLAVDRRRTALTLASAIAPALLLTVLIYAERGGGALIANTIQTIVGSGPARSPTVIASPGPGVSPSSTPGRSPKPVETAAPDPSTVGHIDSIAAGLRLVAANPLGIGLGKVGARPAPGSSDTPGYIVESWFLAMGLMLGWPGLLWALAFPLMLCFMAYLGWVRRRDPLPTIALAAITPVVVIIGVALPTLTEPQIAMFPWVMCGLAVVALQRDGS